MGLLDDVLGSSVPKGNLAKPLLIALGALLASGALHKSTFTSSTGDAGRRDRGRVARGTRGSIATISAKRTRGCDQLVGGFGPKSSNHS